MECKGKLDSSDISLLRIATKLREFWVDGGEIQSGGSVSETPFKAMGIPMAFVMFAEPVLVILTF